MQYRYKSERPSESIVAFVAAVRLITSLTLLLSCLWATDVKLLLLCDNDLCKQAYDYVLELTLFEREKDKMVFSISFNFINIVHTGYILLSASYSH